MASIFRSIAGSLGNRLAEVAIDKALAVWGATMLVGALGVWTSSTWLQRFMVIGVMISLSALICIWGLARRARRGPQFSFRPVVTPKILLPKEGFIRPSGVVLDANTLDASAMGDLRFVTGPIMLTIQVEVTNRSAIDGTDVRGEIVIEGAEGSEIVRLHDTRWEYSDFPATLKTTSRLRFANIAAGDVGRLGVAMRMYDETDAYAIDNSSPTAEWKVHGYRLGTT